jgi:hypothetical protein
MGLPSFTNPQYLLYGLPSVILLVSGFWYLNFRARQAMRKAYGEGELVDAFTRKESFSYQIIALSAWLVATISLVIAAAGPYLSDSPETIKAGSIQAVVVLDVSISMAAEDYREHMPPPPAKPNKEGKEGQQEIGVGSYGTRLDVSKLLISQILRSLQGNEVGLVSYAGKGFPQADLTSDYLALDFVVKNWVRIGNAQGNGSNFGEGILEAINTFKRDENKDKKRVIVLLSDGGLTGEKEKVAEAVDEMRKENIDLIIIGVGLEKPVPIPIYDDNNQFVGYFGAANNQPVSTSLEEGPLTDLASQANGKYIHLDTSYQKLEIPWVKAFGGNKTEPHAVHIYQWFVGLSMLVITSIAFTQFFRNRKQKTFLSNGQKTVS